MKDARERAAVAVRQLGEVPARKVAAVASLEVGAVRVRLACGHVEQCFVRCVSMEQARELFAGRSVLCWECAKPGNPTESDGRERA